MKSKKAKSGKKSEKDLRKTARKELQASVAARFTDAIRGLGHDSRVVSKAVRKAARKIAAELIAGPAGGEPAREKLPGKTGDAGSPKGKVRKPLAQKELVKARKVIARAGRAPAPGLSGTAPAMLAREPDEKPGGDPVSPS